MESTLKYLLYAIFAVAVVSGINVLLGGTSAVPGVTTPAEAAIDNELRFFSVFWIAYGGFCFWVARNLGERQQFIPFIAMIFLFGGIARLISTVLVGMPGNALLGAMVLEFILPAVIYVIYKKQANDVSATTEGTT